MVEVGGGGGILFDLDSVGGGLCIKGLGVWN